MVLELVPVLSLLRNFMYKSQTVKVLQMITSPVSVYMLIIVPSQKVVVSNNYYKLIMENFGTVIKVLCEVLFVRGHSK